MRFGPVETPALLDMAEYIQALANVGVNIDEPIALYLRQIANLPGPPKGQKATVGGEAAADDGEPTEPPQGDELPAPRRRPTVTRTRALRSSDPIVRYSLGLDDPGVDK